MGELIATLDGYSIYKSYINDNDSYYLCIPNYDISKCQVCLGFSNKDLDKLPKYKLISEIRQVNDMICDLNKHSIYAIPTIPINEFEQAVLENDDRMYLNIYKKYVLPVTIAVHDVLIKNNIKDKNVDQVICVVEKNDNDKKFAGWLAMKLGDSYIKEIDYGKLKEEYRERNNIRKLEIGEKEDSSAVIPISDAPLEHIQEVQPVFKSGIAPINRKFENTPTLDKGKEKVLTKNLTKPTEVSSGFSDIKFIILGILISLILGIGLAYLSMK